MSDSGNSSLVPEGFTFTPPPLILNGQSIGGGLNFTAQNAVSQVDQASQAYDFINNVNSEAYGFLGNTFSGIEGYSSPLFTDIIGSLNTIGEGAVGAENEAAKNMCSGFLGCLF